MLKTGFKTFAVAAMVLRDVAAEAAAPRRRSQADPTRAAATSRLEVKAANGAADWLRDGTPYVPIQAQAGQSGLGEVRAGRLWLAAAAQVRTGAPAGMGESWVVACTLTCSAPRHDGARPYSEVAGRTAAAHTRQGPRAAPDPTAVARHADGTRPLRQESGQ